MNSKKLTALALVGLMATQLTTMALAEDVTETVRAQGTEMKVDGNVTVTDDTSAVVAQKGKAEVTGNVTNVYNSEYVTDAVMAQAGSEIIVGGNVTAQSDHSATGVFAVNESEITVGGDVTVTGTADSRTDDSYSTAMGIHTAYDSTVTIGGDVTVNADNGIMAVGVGARNGGNASVEGSISSSDIGISVYSADSEIQVVGDVDAAYYGIQVDYFGEQTTEKQNYIEIGGDVTAEEGCAIELHDTAEVVVCGSVSSGDDAIFIDGAADNAVVVVMEDVVSEEGAAVATLNGSVLIGGDTTGNVCPGGSTSIAAVAVGGTIDGDLWLSENAAVYANSVTNNVIYDTEEIGDVEEVVLGEWQAIYSGVDAESEEDLVLQTYDSVKSIVKYLLDFGSDKENVTVLTADTEYMTTVKALNYDEDDDAQQAAIDLIVEQNGVLTDYGDGTVAGIYLNGEAANDLKITVAAKEGVSFNSVLVSDTENGDTELSKDGDAYVITRDMIKRMLAGKMTAKLGVASTPEEDTPADAPSTEETESEQKTEGAEKTENTAKTEKSEKTEKTEPVVEAEPVEEEQEIPLLAIENEVESAAFIVPEVKAGAPVEFRIEKTGATSAAEITKVTLKLLVDDLPEVGATALGKTEDVELTAEDFTVNEDGTITFSEEFMASLEAGDYVFCIETVNGLFYFCVSVK